MHLLKKTLIDFIKDHLSFAITYLLSSILIISFFYLSNENDEEFLYPMLISVLIFVLFLLVKWFKYYRFHTDIRNCIMNVNYNIRLSTAEQQETGKAISAIHEKYINEINTILLNQRNQKHFLFQWIHNMKTPVSIIDLVIQNIIKENDNPDARIGNINEENRKLFNNLEQVLNILRLDDFAKDYMPETIDLAASVKKVINERKSQFIYNNVFPKFQYNNDAVFVLSDAKWNQFMLEQIVSNAIKYSAVTGQNKNVYFRIVRDGGKTVLTIEDEGVGIPEYDIPRVFEPFFTGENGRNFKNSSGIGLFICKSIAEKLEHEINICSRPGKGTSVSISYLSKM